MSHVPDLILASASPRRRELLERLGLRVRVEPVNLDETPLPDEPAADYVKRMARDKANKAVERLGKLGWSTDPTVTLTPGMSGVVPILAADTTVILNGRILGKPADASEAEKMLRDLAGRRHEVTTAYSIRMGETTIERAVTTSVTLRLIAPAEIDAYVACREWEGKAGGYAVQGIAAVFVTDVRGSITNVIGLPLAEVVADLRAAGGLAHFPPVGFGQPVTGS